MARQPVVAVLLDAVMPFARLVDRVDVDHHQPQWKVARLRGKCPLRCQCPGHQPKTDKPMPVSRTIGRMLYKGK
jgi:hypothetical protein